MAHFLSGGVILNLVSIEENWEWFKKHLLELVKDYNDKYVVVQNKKVIAAYDSYSEAYNDMVFNKKEELGSFIIQMCSLDKEKTTVKIYTPFWQLGDYTIVEKKIS